MTIETTEIKKTAYEKACEKVGMAPATIENFAHETEDERKQAFGEHKFRRCIVAANLDENGKPYIPDWLKSDAKWRNWYWAKEDKSRPSGVGFVFHFSYYVDDDSFLGSRLHSKNSEIAAQLANDAEITEYFNEWMGV